MSEEQNDGFLGRWSRRKVQARSGQPLAEPPAPVVAPQPAAAADGVGDAGYESNQAPAPVDTAPAAIKEEAPAPTLEDVKALTLESDFQPFVARSVAPEVRNAAFKKLFTDPHFNVMDGLDIYIDDYSQPDPLPDGMLQKMASAKFLKLFDDEEEEQVPEGATDAASAPADAAPEPAEAAQPQPLEGGDDVAQSALCTDLPMSPPEGAADHVQDPDLRLQPDDAARRQADRPGVA